MTQVDFHILQDTSLEARWLYTCRLVEKAASLGNSVLIAVDTLDEAEALDDLLWSFKPESFIPHHIINSESECENDVKVEITFSDHSGDHQQVLINLRSQVPEYFSRFTRLSEIVIQEQKVLENTREHYRFYKQRGYPIAQHQR
jgi:DNA polymerase III subunit chi